MKLAQPLVALTTLSSALVHVEAQGYGPLSPKKDAATGLELLQLPDGFTYTSFGWTGQIMTDGNPTPTDHDGMAVVGQVKFFVGTSESQVLMDRALTHCLFTSNLTAKTTD